MRILLPLILIISLCSCSSQNIEVNRKLASSTELNCHNLAENFLEIKAGQSLKNSPNQILNLPPGARLPDSVFSRSTHDIGEDIVIRFQKLKEEYGFSTGRDITSESELILFFDSKNINSMADFGILNQHQTKSSNGLLDLKLRKKIEDFLTQLSLGESENALKLRPKFAFLNIHSEEFLGEKIAIPHKIYGSIGAVFKKSVNKRTLWAVADSNALLSDSVKYNRSSRGMYSKFGTLEKFDLPPEVIDYDIQNKWKYNNYFEAIIFGELSLNDIEHFVVVHESDAEILKRYGKPIYLVEAKTKYNRVIYSKTKRLN